MRHAKAVLEIAYGTGEPSAVNTARSVREGVDGKGPGNRNLASDLLHGYVRFGGGPTEKGPAPAGTSPAAYPTARRVRRAGRGNPPGAIRAGRPGPTQQSPRRSTMPCVARFARPRGVRRN